MTDRVLSNSIKSISNKKREEFHKIAILLFKIKLIRSYHHLWTTYLKSGTGQLITSVELHSIYPNNLSVWPQEIKQIVRSISIDPNKNLSKLSEFGELSSAST